MKVGLCLHTNSIHRSFLFVSCMNMNQIKLSISSLCAECVSGPYGYSDFFDRAMGLLTPWSHVPHMLVPYGDNMSYFERVHNVILSAYDWWFRNWVLLPQQHAIAQRYFGHLASMF